MIIQNSREKGIREEVEEEEEEEVGKDGAEEVEAKHTTVDLVIPQKLKRGNICG